MNNIFYVITLVVAIYGVHAFFLIRDFKKQRKLNEVFWSFMDTIKNRAKVATSSEELFELRRELKEYCAENKVLAYRLFSSVQEVQDVIFDCHEELVREEQQPSTSA